MLSRNQISEIQEQAFLGLPSQLNGVCKVYPLTIGQIVGMGESEYRKKLGMLLLTEVDIAEMIKKKIGEEVPIEQIIPIKYLLQSAALDDTILLELQNTFATFVQEEVLILPKISSVLVGKPEDRRLINEKNFRDFQDILRIQNKYETKEPPPENESPGQRKMRLLREKVAEVKKKKAQKNNEGQSLLDLLEIGQVFGIDVKNCTLFALYNLIRRYQLKEKWNQDLQAICAGADSKNIKTQYWGESLNNKQEGR